MDRLFAVTAILSLTLIGIVMHSLRRYHIRVEYSVSWLVAGLVMLLLSVWNPILTELGRLLGTGDHRSTIYFIALGVFAAVFYRFSIIISKLKDSNIALTQKLAMLEFQLRALDEKQKQVPAS